MLALCHICALSLQLSSLRVLQVQREAIQAVEQDGIVFIDEIDKIVVNQDLRYGEQLVTLSCPCVPYGTASHNEEALRLTAWIAQPGRPPLRGRPCSKRGCVL